MMIKQKHRCELNLNLMNYLLWLDYGNNGNHLKGHSIFTCTVITTTANELMKDIHDRMPVILKPEDEKTWLDPTIHDIN